MSSIHTFSVGNVYHFETTTSTNDLALNGISMDSNTVIMQPGDVVTAAKQTAGRGRRLRTWHSDGDNLYFSFVLPYLEPIKYFPVNIAVGYGIVDGINESTSLDAKMKWPNDVLIDGKKVAGVLFEAKTMADKTRCVAGIGINVNQTKMQKDIEDTATSLKLLLKQEVCKDTLLKNILKKLELHINSVNGTNIKHLWSDYSAFFNKQISIKLDKGIMTVTEMGINDNGYMVAELPTKEIVEISCGEIGFSVG